MCMVTKLQIHVTASWGNSGIPYKERLHVYGTKIQIHVPASWGNSGIPYKE